MNFRPRLAGAAVIFSRHVPLISMTVAWYMQPGGIVRESLGERVSRVRTYASLELWPVVASESHRRRSQGAANFTDSLNHNP